MRHKLALTIALASFAVVPRSASASRVRTRRPASARARPPAASRRPRPSPGAAARLRQRSRRRRRRPGRPRRPRLRIALRHDRGTRTAGAGEPHRRAAPRRRPARSTAAPGSTPRKPPPDQGGVQRNQGLGGGASSGGVGAPSATAGDQPQEEGPDGGSQFGQRRRPDERQPEHDDRPLRPGADRRPELRHRLLRDPALPAADLPGLRNRVRDPLGGARLDQQNRDRVRHQPQRLQRRRDGLDAVHPLQLGDVRRRRQRRRPQGPLQPGRRDLRRGPAT